MAKITINGWDRRSWTLSIIVAALIAVLLWLVYFYHEDGQEIKIITIDNPNSLSIRNFSKDFNFVQRNESKTAIVVQNEDLVAINSIIIPVNSVRSDHWNVILKDSSKLFINNALKGMVVFTPGTFQQLFNLREEELKELTFIDLFYYNVQVKSFLEKLSRINSKTIIYVEGDDYAAIQQQVVTLFNSRNFFLHYDRETLDLLSKKKSRIDHLWIQFDDSALVSPLPKFHKLKDLSLVSYHQTIPAAFLENNQSVKGVYISSDSDSIDLSKTKLRHLSYGSNKNLTIEKFQEKKIDYFNGTINDQTIMELSNMKRLKWLNANVENLDQLQFEGMINAIPDVQVLDLLMTERNFSLHSLDKLSHLKALVITYSDSLDIASIKQLAGLKYLSINYEKEKDSTIYEQLKQALPGTVVVRHDGPCMGSGYVLLIPLISLAMYFLKRSKVF